MNNIDVSLMNVLKSHHANIFNLYFNDSGSIPNPNVAMRTQAKDIFKKYSTENFDQFVQKYQNHMAKLKKDSCIEKVLNKGTQTLAVVSEGQRENIICEEDESPVNMNIQDQISCQASTSQTSTIQEQNCRDNSIFQKTLRITPLLSNKRIREKFDAFKFLKEKQKKKEYAWLHFQSDKIEEEFLIINGCMDINRNNRLAKDALKKMAEYLEILNKTCRHRILDIHFENI